MWSRDELETVSCDLCKGHETFELWVRPDGMRVVECVHCGLAFLSPRPRSEFISHLYKEDYFKKRSSEAKIGYVKYMDAPYKQALIRLAAARLELFDEIWQPDGQRCLEIGCASGEFCHVLQQHGAWALGTDISDYAIAEARKEYPTLNFRIVDAEQVVDDEPFDAVFAFELIEHVLSPSRFLRSVNRLLRPGGFFVLSTPNLDCGKAIGVERWLGFNISFEHLFFFTPDVLSRFADQEGFRTKFYMTGGNGIYYNMSTMTLRDRVRDILHELRLLESLRKVKRALLGSPAAPVWNPPQYSAGGTGHNLVMCLEKKESMLARQ